MTSREICFLCFVQHNARFWKCLWDFFGFKRVKTSKKFSRSYLQRRKMEKRKKKLLTTWECLNYKKSSQQSPSCVLSTRDSLFCKMFSPLFSLVQEKTRKEKKKEKTTVTHSPVARVPLLCFTTFWRHLWFYYWTDARQHGIYLLKIWIWDLWSILC